ncbi:O-antigen ligase C-terminal domain-containing protein [Pantoea agglomerans]|uniref:O-antigen ligase C-terminal domain-containing protein n=2 Tax=Enterobacter agglomerans TaxID=549 RepID=A0AAN2K408_ENTAG|nr:O-antigen ligase C-terminal domain-containing protein [Pantoea agglomerans]
MGALMLVIIQQLKLLLPTMNKSCSTSKGVDWLTQPTYWGRFLIFTVIFVVTIYFLLLNHIYIKNMGGAGLLLPLNIITWSLMLLISALLMLSTALLNKRILFTTEIRLGLLAALLMTLPVCWTPAVNYSNALPRLAAIWGALIFSMSLRQMHLSNTAKHAILMLILISALLESLLSLFQWGWPTLAQQLMEYNIGRAAGRPYGIFQQPNLLASYVATGYAVAVYFFYRQATLQRSLVVVLLLLQGVMLWVLLLSGSRVGLYGALLALFLLSAMISEFRQRNDQSPLTFRKHLSLAVRWLIIMLLILTGLLVNVIGGLMQRPESVMNVSLLLIASGMLWCLLIAGKDRASLIRQACCFTVMIVCAAGFFLPPTLSSAATPVITETLPHSDVTGPDLVHAGSSSERLNMLKGSLSLILQHPWAGVGLGGFEAAFATVRENYGTGIGSYTVRHPHNELLYVLVEGGPLALSGLCLAAIACFLPALNALRTRNKKYTTALTDERCRALAVAVLLLPISLHVLLEYPFYQSASHLLVFLLLVRISQPEMLHQHRTIFVQHRRVNATTILLIFLSVGLLLAACDLLAGLKIQQQLTLAERYDLQSLPPDLPFSVSLTQYERYDFDRHTQELLKYNREHNSQLLEDYAHWAQVYLAVHNDAGVYASAIRIALYQGNTTLANKLAAQARLSFYADSRFKPKQISLE